MPPPLQSSHLKSKKTQRGSPPSPPPLKSKQKLLSLILKSIIMMFLICFFFLILPLASFLLFIPLILRHRLHRHRLHSHTSPGFSSKQLKKLPQFRFSEETKAAANLESDPCVICLDEFRKGQMCRNLVGCGHVFHRKCLDAWLIKITDCPICSTRVCLENEDKCITDCGTSRTEFQGLLDL